MLNVLGGMMIIIYNDGVMVESISLNDLLVNVGVFNGGINLLSFIII